MVIVPLLVLLGVILAAAASFFFSLAETALFSLGKWQVRILTEQSPRRGARVAALLASPQDLLATIALGNTVASCLMLGLALWMVLAGHWPIVITLILVLVLALVAGEVLPKTFAVREPERWALIVAGPLSVVMVFTGPLHRLAQAVNEKVLSLVIPKNLKPLPALTDDDYAELLEVATHQGVLAASEKDVLVRIIGLDRRTVKEVMKPRARISFISDDLTVPEMVEAARKARHRRIPMYDETPDTIVGV
ncbi:MAG TPA: CNNM domain-containing protein, partial [Roseimicrobium sp.]|nr:CNNM domain-containing protein [Roseimicrobium sp.]